MWALGLMLLDTGRVDDGMQQLERALSIDQRRADRWLIFSQVSLQAGAVEKALTAVRRAEELNDESIPILVQKYVVLRALDRIDEAARTLHALMEMMPIDPVHAAGGDPALATAYATVLGEQATRQRLAGHPERAADLLTTALKLTPNHPNLLLELARARQASGDLDGALPIMNTLMQTYPDAALPATFVAKPTRRPSMLKRARAPVNIRPFSPGMLRSYPGPAGPVSSTPRPRSAGWRPDESCSARS